MSAPLTNEQTNTQLTFRLFRNGDRAWKRWQDKILEADASFKCPTYVQETPPCQGSCPAGEDIRSYLNIVRGIEKPPVGADGKPTMPWQEYAWRRLTDCNPFPAVMGRVCPAPCQGGCNRSKVEDYVGINSVEQFLGNYAIENGLGFAKPAKETGKRVAIIGGGVGGLACAYQLRKKGHACVIFDAYGKLGGMLAFGLPSYRADHGLVDKEVKRIIDMGVEVRLNTRVGKDVSFEDLKRDFDAVFIAIGAQKGNRLDIPGADAPNCIDGLKFLRDFNEDKLTDFKERVVVIGGGNTAMDVAAVALRTGSLNAKGQRENGKVMVAYRRTIEEMPADEIEINAVVQEGGEIQIHVIPVSVVKGADGRATALRVAKVEWVNKKMAVKEGSEYDIPCDLIVAAMGQSVEWDDMGGVKNAKNLANIDKAFQAVGTPGVFIGGDAVYPDLLTTAIGHGRIAAEGIDDYVMGRTVEKRPKVDKNLFDLTGKLTEKGIKLTPASEPLRGTCDSSIAIHNYDNRSDRTVVKPEELFLAHFTYTPRKVRDMKKIDTSNVIGNSEERMISLTEAQAQAEAKRCMSCGMCFECDNCVVYCPQGAVKKVPKAQATTGRYVTTEYDKCVGCHICKDVCPTGYIQMGLGE
ncbi:MAG: NAD(P)-binding protein [Sulfuritalea sp.]|jgi:NADPH-dependent glutamate synthase beta subunit-like oxidoreductase|nr:NAD(P)-binding protein [Sulfuritalea sp.]